MFADVLGSSSLLKQRREPSFIQQEWQKSTPADFKRLKTVIPRHHPHRLSVDDIHLQGRLQGRSELFLSGKKEESCAKGRSYSSSNVEKDFFALSPHRPVDNIEGGNGGGPLKNREPFTFLSLNKTDATSGGKAELPPQNVDDINVQGGFEERRRSFFLPNDHWSNNGYVSESFPNVKKVPSPPCGGRSVLDFLMDDGHISSRKERGGGDTCNTEPPRIKSFRTELDLCSIEDLLGQNVTCSPSAGEFKDNPFKLDVNDLVDEYVPAKDEEMFSSPDSSPAAALPQVEMQQQRRNGGNNDEKGNDLDISDSNPVFPLAERSSSGSKDNHKEDGRAKRDQINTRITPIFTDSEMRIPVNEWLLADKELDLNAYGM